MKKTKRSCKTVPSEYSSAKSLSITNGLEACECMSHASWTVPPWSLSCARHVEQLWSESCSSGKKRSPVTLRTCLPCASVLLAPFSNRHLLDPILSRFGSLIKVLEQTHHDTLNVQNTCVLLIVVPMESPLMFGRISSLHFGSCL